MSALRGHHANATVAEALNRIFNTSTIPMRAPPTFLRGAIRGAIGHQRSKFHAYAPCLATYQPVQARTDRQSARFKKIPDILLHPNRDEGIRSRTVQVVDPDTNKLAEQPLDSVLEAMDRKNFYLVRVSRPEDEGAPICKILLRRTVHEADRARQIAAHKADHTRKGNSAKKKGHGEAGKLKVVEIAWGIEPGDLDTRMRRMKDFLTGGLRVEVGLHVKKRSKEVSQEKASNVLSRVKQDVDLVKGRIIREEGKVGEVLRLLIEPSQHAREKEAEETKKKLDTHETKAKEEV